MGFPWTPVILSVARARSEGTRRPVSPHHRSPRASTCRDRHQPLRGRNACDTVWKGTPACQDIARQVFDVLKCCKAAFFSNFALECVPRRFARLDRSLRDLESIVAESLEHEQFAAIPGEIRTDLEDIAPIGTRRVPSPRGAGMRVGDAARRRSRQLFPADSLALQAAGDRQDEEIQGGIPHPAGVEGVNPDHR